MKFHILSACLVALIAIAAAACSIDDQLAGEKDQTGADDPDIAATQLGSADSANSTYQGDLAWCELKIHDLSHSLPYHFWSFEGVCDDVFIDLANRDGKDTFLLLYANEGGGWQLIDWNDDCYAGTLNSCLEIETVPGVEYLVGATTYEFVYWGAREDVNYHLQVSCRDEAGECVDPTTPVQQLCGSRGLDPCPEGQYCDWEPTGDAPACGATDIPGVCQPIPDACPRVNEPVCGCDGTTYANDCYAAMLAGVDVSYEGSCHGDPRSEGEACGGFAGFLCDREQGLVCDYSINDFCGVDLMGVCVVDEELYCTTAWAPVCGCDGNTYGNDCQRRAAYVPFDHFGQCED